MKTSHWEVEKAFMDVVYDGFVLVFFLIITYGVSAMDSAFSFLLMWVGWILVVWNAFLFLIHVRRLRKCIILYDKENESVN